MAIPRKQNENPTVIPKVEERLWGQRGMVSQEARKENSNSWKQATPTSLILQTGPFTSSLADRRFQPTRGKGQPWWIPQDKDHFVSLLKAHHHLRSPPNTHSHTYLLPFLCITLGWASFRNHRSLYLFSFGSSSFPWKRIFFFCYQVSVYYFLKFWKKSENRYYLTLSSPPSSLDWVIATVDNLVFYHTFK